MTKEERREYDRQWYLKNRKKKLEQQKQYRQEHKEEIAEYQKQYQKQYQQEHKEEIKEHQKQYQQEHKEEIKEYQKQYYKQYHQTPIGRAANLIGRYRQNDKEHSRGECTLTTQWIIDNIFTSKCHWCGETDWTKLGCDRIDNSLPHTPDNVNPCCEDCNKKRGKKAYEEFLKEIQLT